MSFQQQMMERFPEIFYLDEEGNQFCPCGVYCPEGWQPLVEVLLESIHYRATRVKISKKNPDTKNFYRMYNAFYVPVYNFLSKMIDPWKKSNPSGKRVFHITPDQREDITKTWRYKLHRKLTDFSWKLRKGRPEYIGVPLRPVYIDQIKEKFGSLRVYVTGGDEEIQGMISLAEHMSSKICEITGDPGSMHVRGNWYKTLSNDKAYELGYRKALME